MEGNSTEKEEEKKGGASSRGKEKKEKAVLDVGVSVQKDWV